MREIEIITKATEYIVAHLNEYKDTSEEIKWKLQDYLDKAWNLQYNSEASEDEVLYIRDLRRLVIMFFDVIERIEGLVEYIQELKDAYEKSEDE